MTGNGGFPEPGSTIGKIAVVGIAATVALALATSLFPGHAGAQTAGKVHRIGVLHPNDIEKSTATPAFFRRLRELGYVEGRNVAILRKSARGRRDRLPRFAAELVRDKVDVIVGPVSGVWAAARASRTIPIVVTVGGDLVARGWARSLRRPGGTVTGLSTLAQDLVGKQLEILKQIKPNSSRIAVLMEAGNPGNAEELRQAMEPARRLGLVLVAIQVERAGDLPAAFDRMKDQRIDGIVVLRSGFLLGFRGRVAALARDARLPSMFGHRREAVVGGLAAYGADNKALWAGAAIYVDKILKGAEPGELPITQARKFNLTVNLRTAKALGIAVPPSILLRADKVIE